MRDDGVLQQAVDTCTAITGPTAGDVRACPVFDVAEGVLRTLTDSNNCSDAFRVANTWYTYPSYGHGKWYFMNDLHKPQVKTRQTILSLALRPPPGNRGNRMSPLSRSSRNLGYQKQKHHYQLRIGLLPLLTTLYSTWERMGIHAQSVH